MTPALARVRPSWDLVLTRPAGVDVEALSGAGCRTIPHPGPMLPGLVSGVWLGRMGARLRADAVVSQYFGPWGRSSVPHVTVVHDALWIEHPEWFDRRPRTMLRLVRPSLRGSTTVTVSHAAARQLRTCGLVAAAHVVPNGVDLPVAGELVAPGSRRGGLVVARANVRKNLVTAVTAWVRSGASEPLSVVGATAAEVAHLVGGPLPPDVEALGRVDDTTLRRHYATARVVLAPSLGEGFSLPPLEAMAHATPVIASDIDAHRELYDGTAVLVPPLDVEAWAAAVARAFDEGEGAARRGAAGRRLAESMTWDAAGERLAQLIEDLTGSP